MCDGFGICSKHAPEYFPLDDWGYASMEGGNTIAPEHRDGALRALLDCPAHAIIAMDDEGSRGDQAG